MEDHAIKQKIDFGHLYHEMLQNEQIAEKALTYLHKKKKIDKALIYNELFSKKLIGYAPERKALAFPLVRGFLVVGIRYLAMESVEINGRLITEGEEFSHEGSDVETGLFSLQKDFKAVMITSSILDLLSADLSGVSLPSLTELQQLHLFTDMDTTVCFNNTEDGKRAGQKVLEILPKARVIDPPKEFTSIHHLLMENGQDSVRALLTMEKRTDEPKEPQGVSINNVFEAATCRYFPHSGPDNTETTLKVALERATALKIRKILISSVTGATAFKALDTFGKGFSLVVVTHATGFKKPDQQTLPDKDRKTLIEKGAFVLTTQHAFGGVGRAVRNKTGTYQIDEIIAHTLRVFGQGTKVAVEITLMAADAGLIRTDEDVISIGGTASGVDTALLLKPANTYNFFDLKVKEIICKPSDF